LPGSRRRLSVSTTCRERYYYEGFRQQPKPPFRLVPTGKLHHSTLDRRPAPYATKRCGKRRCRGPAAAAAFALSFAVCRDEIEDAAQSPNVDQILMVITSGVRNELA